MTERPPVIDLGPAERWTQDGYFLDAEGAPVRAYDDVILLRSTLPENDPSAAYLVPEGTVGTVLFHCGESDTGPLQIELYWSQSATVIGYALSRDVRLHQTSEQKYPS